ncbi:general odorant-binding protein 68 [Scaptodrosophila lebanonensis]|uniref:General odorant-binding protein 68 n=1 Tax=Drosophila lebanonensis TaxID=7225 RepID=A0A6J2UJE3_DROLE|nr:general odorant-binding protein 68 [Scaptodrosophila lebanonensis]
MFAACLLLILLVPQVYTVRVHCRHMERIHEDHIHYCCKHPDGHNDVSESCAKKTNYRLPGPNEEDIIDNTVDQVMGSTCFGECVFNHYKFLKNNTLDMEAVIHHYKTVHKEDPEYETEMLQAFDKCHSKSEDATAMFLELPIIRAFSSSTHCNPKPSIILSCVIYNFFHNCPRNRWSNSTECVETLAFAKKCKDVLTTM